MSAVSRGSKSTFSFYLSSDVNLQVRVRVSGLHGLLPGCRPGYSADAAFQSSAAYVVVALVSGNETLGLECKSTYAHSNASGVMWNEWLVFCVKYRDLPDDAQLALHVYDVAEGRGVSLVGGSTMPMFNKHGRLKTGPQRLQVWDGREPCRRFPSSTPGKAPLKTRGRLAHLEHLIKLYNRGDMARADWLDGLTMAEVRQLQVQELQSWHGKHELQLVLELPSFPHAVLYHQPASRSAAASQTGSAAAAVAGGGAKKEATAGGATLTGGERAQGDTTIILLHDPEVGRENPAELKAQKLQRSLTRGVIDRDLKPNSDERRRIQQVLKLPPNKLLSADDKALLWRFRFSLTKEMRALTKFLKCVDWSDLQEAKQAVDLMREWETIQTADAMELLSPDFRNEEVRGHAASVLSQKDDDELLHYLLQLVQALRYESGDQSSLSKFLVQRASSSATFAILLHWYLFVEWEDPSFGARATAVHAALVAALQRAPSGERMWEAIRRQTDMVSQLNFIMKELKGSRLKAQRAAERLREMVSESGPCGELTVLRVPLPLNPAILLAGIVPSECSCFKSAQLPLLLSFKIDLRPVDWSRTSAPHHSSSALSTQGSHRDHDMDSIGPAPSFGGGGGGGSRTGPASGPSMFSGPSGTAAGHHAHNHHGSGHHHEGPSLSASASALPPPPPQHHSSPAEAVQALLQKLGSNTGIVMKGDSVRCLMIYKKGDDLRQDQFILQMLNLMDRLLKRENLDLRLTPYKVLPTSSDDGLVEFVPSTPLSRVLSEHKTIHKYLTLHAAEPGAPFGLRPDVLEAFVRSCAGYCVMTYILGVGDRHLDNLMLTTDGRLFHIDFGYILGNDPKPFPPPMKLCKEMIEAMGGQGSTYYVQFRMYACEAYNILRKSADLILSLFHLMAGASIDTIRQDPEKAILKLQEKFRLDLDDEAAVEWMQALINESATALMPQIVETTHRWAQYWR